MLVAGRGRHAAALAPRLAGGALCKRGVAAQALDQVERSRRERDEDARRRAGRPREQRPPAPQQGSPPAGSPEGGTAQRPSVWEVRGATNQPQVSLPP